MILQVLIMSKTLKAFLKRLKNKRLLALILVIPFLANMPVSAQEKVPVPQTVIEAKPIDKRAEILQAYLAQYNSPMQYQAQAFVETADQYNLDWKLLPAIAGVESTFGKFIPGGYNAWGWGVYGNQAIYFNSWKEGMLAVSEGLKTHYINNGLTDPYKINRIYSTSPAWGANVTYFINDLENFMREYQKEHDGTISANLSSPTAGTSATLALKNN